MLSGKKQRNVSTKNLKQRFSNFFFQKRCSGEAIIFVKNSFIILNFFLSFFIFESFRRRFFKLKSFTIMTLAFVPCSCHCLPISISFNNLRVFLFLHFYLLTNSFVLYELYHSVSLVFMVINYGHSLLILRAIDIENYTILSSVLVQF